MRQLDVKRQTSGIYQITNLSNSKVYIGSAVCLKQRSITHISNLLRNKHHSPHLQNSFNKNGRDSFEIDILQICRVEDLLFYEQKWIDLTQSIHAKFGYNICPIAGNCLGVKHSKETRLKVSESQLKSVLQYDLNGNFIKEWKSQKEIAFIFNCRPCCINGAISGRKRSAKNYMWRLKYIEEYPTKIDNYKSTIKPQGKRISIEKDNNKEEFKSVSELCKHLNIKHTSIHRHMKTDNVKRLKGYKIEYI